MPKLIKIVAVLGLAAAAIYALDPVYWTSSEEEFAQRVLPARAEAARRANVVALENQCAETARNTVGTADVDNYKGVYGLCLAWQAQQRR